MYDLHLHTAFSDGALTPTELIDLCTAQGLNAVAITDHNTTAGIMEAYRHATTVGGPEVVPGVEISTYATGVHILAYVEDYENPAFQAELKQIRQAQYRAIKQTVEQLRQFGIGIHFKRVEQLAGEGSIGRRHVALALVETGAVESVEQGFALYLQNGAPACVKMEVVPQPDEVVRAIRRVGGVAALAHPQTVPDLSALLPILCAAGLQGMEVYCPTDDPARRHSLMARAAKYDLLPLGGSDFHQPNDVAATPVDTGMPATVFARLLTLARHHSSVWMVATGW